MTALDFARLREGDAGCPSDLALDRLHVGELAEAESRQITAHIATCATCPGRIAARQAGFAAFPEVDPRPLLAAVRRRLHESAREPVGRRWLRQLGLYFAPVAAVTAALAIFLVVRHGGKAVITEPPGSADGVTYETRAKGGLGLHVYRFAEGKTSQETVSGDSFAPGDHLRFVVDLPARGQVQIIGIESSGNLYVAWPNPWSEAPVSTLRPAGKGQELPGAVALDYSPGRETLYLVHCAETSAAAPQCTSQGAGKSPQCPPGCRLVPYVIDKVK